jgi:NAD(P)-dependent dehydrogenase (short-subunit alcohol dehydrogenase family)
MSDLKGQWALILGASSGFGEAVSLELAKRGMSICGVHLDRKATLPNVERITSEIKKLGAHAEFFNVNAADEANRKEVLDTMASKLHGKPFRTLLHSLAFGTLKPFVAEKADDAINAGQIDMTLNVMANSLVHWVQELFLRKMLGKGSKIFAMTSAGGARIWPNYGAVSAAKAALESHIRQLAVELAPAGIAANAIRAGVTDTPALRKIPGNEQMIEMAIARNPGKRLTLPADVAKIIAALSVEGIEWMTGNVISVDGGEFVV